MEDEFYDLSSFAVEDSSMEGMSLLDTVKSVKPNILIGKSGTCSIKQMHIQNVTIALVVKVHFSFFFVHNLLRFVNINDFCQGSLLVEVCSVRKY